MNSYRWIPWVFIAGLGVVVMVNGALAYFAATSSTGLVSEHPYDDGNSYNRVLDAAAAQDALGWRGELRFRSLGAARGELVAELGDGQGRPLTGATVSARLTRPVEPLPEVTVVLHESTPGRYVGEAAPGRAGQWDVHAAARRGGDSFEFARRIVIQ